MTRVRLDDLIHHVIEQDPDGGPLERLAAAVVLSETLGELADHLVGHFVDQARRAGASWTEIGQSMGVTKQAAQKRFVAKPAQATGLGSPFSRFTPRARQAVSHAQELARAAGHTAIEPEHVVLGDIADEGGFAARAVAAVAPLETVRERLREALGPAQGDPPAHIPFTPRSKKLVELTVRESERLGHEYIGTEHILLGALTDADSAGARILTDLGVTREGVEEWVLAELNSLPSPPLGRLAPP